jgi:hypothetical protein
MICLEESFQFFKNFRSMKDEPSNQGISDKKGLNPVQPTNHQIDQYTSQ